MLRIIDTDKRLMKATRYSSLLIAMGGMTMTQVAKLEVRAMTEIDARW